MEPFILYQALICLIVALPCTATGFLLGLHHAQRKAELKPTNDADLKEKWMATAEETKRLADAEKDKMPSFALAGTTLEAGLQPRSVRRPYSSSFSPCHCGAKSKDGCCCQTENSRS